MLLPADFFVCRNRPILFKGKIETVSTVPWKFQYTGKDEIIVLKVMYKSGHQTTVFFVKKANIS